MKKQIKYTVLYICHDVGLGGAAKSLLDMLGELNGTIIPLVIIPKKGMIETELIKMNIEYYIFPFKLNWGAENTSTKIQDDKLFKLNFDTVLEICQFLAPQNIRLVHSNAIVSPIGAMISLLLDVPHVWHIREFVEEDFQCELYDKELYHVLFEATDTFIAISKSIQISYKNKYKIDSVHIYNGINIDKNGRTCPPDDSSFLLAGAIQEGKGQWDAVHAVELLVNKNITNIHLYIVGNDTSRYAWCIKHYIKNNQLEKYVTLLPYQQDFNTLRQKCKYSLTTSKMEALGRVTVEAMLWEQIVIGADTGGTLEIIGKNEERGFLYQQGSYRSLAASIERALQTKLFNIHKVKHEIDEIFNVQKYTHKILQVYDELINSRKSSSDELRQAKKYLFDRYELVKASLSTIDNINQGKVNPEKDIKEILGDNTEKIYEFFNRQKIKTVAIYGMGAWGCALFDELQQMGIKIKYVVDNSNKYLEDIICVYKMGDHLPKVDLLIVSIKKEPEAIKEKLEKLYDLDIRTIYEISE